jgi:hypothetical protein
MSLSWENAWESLIFYCYAFLSRYCVAFSKVLHCTILIPLIPQGCDDRYGRIKVTEPNSTYYSHHLLHTPRFREEIFLFHCLYYIVVCFLTERTVEPGNGCVTRRNGVTVGNGVFCEVRAEDIYTGPKLKLLPRSFSLSSTLLLFSFYISLSLSLCNLN